MWFRKFDQASGKEYAGPLADADLQAWLIEDCMMAAYAADTAAGTPTIGMGALDLAVQLQFDQIEVCNSGVDTSLGAWQFTLPHPSAWQLNCGLEGSLPGGWATANISLYVYKNGALFRRIDRRRFLTGDADFFLGNSLQIWGTTSDVFTIWISQSGAAPQTIVTWKGWVDVFRSRWTNCAACTP